MAADPDAAARYAYACERRDYAIAAWEAAGKPLLAPGGATGKAEVPHPLWVMVDSATVLCDRLAKSVRAQDRPGRPAGASSAPDRGEPPKRTLKAV